ncbi:MAG: hypothetical protein KFW09_01915 [Oscillospiraceae bacterium]|nr:hypothetical protein [Oscillospiraceae bacterium]
MSKENYIKPTSDTDIDNKQSLLDIPSSNVEFIETPADDGSPNIAYSGFSDDDLSNSIPPDFPNLKLPPIKPNENLKSILKNPKNKKKKNKISFEEGDISEEDKEEIRIKEIILKGKLDTFKSVFTSRLLNVSNYDEKDILLKKHKKDIAARQKEIHTWSTRGENVRTTGWSFEPDDPNERIRTEEQKTRLPKCEAKIYRQRIKYETRIDTLTEQHNNLTAQEVRLESEIKMQKDKVKEKPIPSFVRKLVLKSLTSHTKKIKQLKEVSFQKINCKSALDQQIFEQKNHQAKYPTYYKNV